MKKDGIVTLFVVLLILSLILIVSAAETTDDAKVAKAYTCLEEQVESACDELTVEQQAFTVMATGKCSSELEDNSKDNECWPSSSCKLKETALALLAFDAVNEDTSGIEEWLLNQKQNPEELVWYLQIDADEETTCQITYTGTDIDVIVGEDKKINRNAGSCLRLTRDNYWFKVEDDCYEENFTISCDKSFITALVYSKQNGETIYIPNEKHSSSADGKTEEKINTFCFKEGESCDYEGSLWAVLALAKVEEDISDFLPYLTALADENEKYFPETFLYAVTGYDEYLVEIQTLGNDGHWRIQDSPDGTLYDTSLAMYALYGSGAAEFEAGRTYLLGAQDDNGCWGDNNVRDTAFILHAAWPKEVSITNPSPDCETELNYYCVSLSDCATNNLIEEARCFGGKVCCKEEPEEKSCTEKNGEICDADEECDGGTVSASDTRDCCSGECIPKSTETECEAKSSGNYSCRADCKNNEIIKSNFECSGNDICCAPNGGGGGGGKSYWWIWLLISLIILVVLGIIFRGRLKVFIYKTKNRFKKGPPPGTPGQPSGYPPRPGPPGGAGRPMLIRRPMPGMGPRPAMRRPPMSSKDRELEETLKKLKEMSK